MFASTVRHVLRGFPRPKRRAPKKATSGGFTYGRWFLHFRPSSDNRLPGRHRLRAR